MITHLERLPDERGLPRVAYRPLPRRSRRRIVVVEDDLEMLELLRGILDPEYEVAVPAAPVTIASIDAEDPDVLVIGTADSGPGASLSPAEIAALAGRHMRLHRVPVVVLTADATILADAQRLAEPRAVTVVLLPFDVETINCVLKSVARRSAIPDPMRISEL